MRLLSYLLWGAIAATAAFCLGGVALIRGEHINSIWLVLAAACTYITAYRFYGRFVAARVMALVPETARDVVEHRAAHPLELVGKANAGADDGQTWLDNWYMDSTRRP